MTGRPVAVIGLACRVPGADDLDQYWANLRDGVESVTVFEPAELRAAGVGDELLRRPDYVPAAPVLADPSLFDAAFFGYPPGEASALDPQHRLFLECAWTAVEHAGYAPGGLSCPVGVYGGSALNSYLLFSGLLPRLVDDYLLTLTASDKDFLATRVSYQLGLTGPSLTVQTACSTSLVAVHLAVRALLGGECDMALAGGVSVRVPHRVGYLHDGGHMLSADGHCRPFDAAAGGTLFGSGAGVVVLKRLADAIADRDTVHAVVTGTACNNDGSAKAGYSAPSVRRQAAAVADAFESAGVDPDTVSYVEAHGTGTPIGDPIEVAALTRAYRRFTGRRGFCAIGSVKANIGHLDAAAGVAGLIKTVLALRHEAIPPTVNFREPHPDLRLDETPFRVADRLVPWPRGPVPRRAAVNALGVGGTNAHVVVEEAPPAAPPAASRPVVLLPVSARTPAALATATHRVAEHAAGLGDDELADAAYTLQVGRKAFEYRGFAVGRRIASDPVPACGPEPPAVVFLLPGQGAQRAGMGAALYQREPVFREHADRCAGLFGARTGAGPVQAALFTLEYALSMLWESWGIRPDALIGHSLGEVVAACVAGVLPLESATALVTARERLMGTLPRGAMLAVPLPEDEVRRHLPDGLVVAAVNAPAQCVVAGRVEPIEALAVRFGHSGVPVRRLPVAHAFHSPMVDPVVAPFHDAVRHLPMSPSRTPIVSTATGTWLRDDEATSAGYWAAHLRRPVRFADGLRTLAADLGHYVLLEVGPGRTLGGVAQQQPGPHAVVSTLSGRGDDQAAAVEALGRLWAAGVEPDWAAVSGAGRRRVPMPTYPFQRQRHWVRPNVEVVPGAPLAAEPPPTPRTAVAGNSGPGTAVEAAVAAVWREVLGDVAIGRRDNFYRLGGHSMLLTRVAARLSRVFGIDLPVLTTMEAPTVEQLAARIEDVFRHRHAKEAPS